VPFLGFRHFATHRRLKRPNVVRFRRRLRRLQQAYAAGRISLDKVGESIQSWCAHAAHGNTYRLRNQILRQTIFRPMRAARRLDEAQRGAAAGRAAPRRAVSPVE